MKIDKEVTVLLMPASSMKATNLKTETEIPNIYLSLVTAISYDI